MFSCTPGNASVLLHVRSASDLIYLFKEGIEEGGRAVTFQFIHQCKGPFPLETGVIPTEP